MSRKDDAIINFVSFATPRMHTGAFRTRHPKAVCRNSSSIQARRRRQKDKQRSKGRCEGNTEDPQHGVPPPDSAVNGHGFGPMDEPLRQEHGAAWPWTQLDRWHLSRRQTSVT